MMGKIEQLFVIDGISRNSSAMQRCLAYFDIDMLDIDSLFIRMLLYGPE
jgi:hypothetical protein